MGSVRQSLESMISPPVRGAARELWYRGKVLEVTALALLPEDGEEFFCQRQKRLGRERIEAVKALLAENIEVPLTLEELGRRVGCSPFYLSRLFSEATGMTMARYLRDLRLERAAELLRSGEYNVTEAAMAVGYSSLSHFSKAFAVRFGSCPCAFPLRRRTVE
jgi:AraC-like DNA-binding protein